MKTAIFDIESDGFLKTMTKIHCVWIYILEDQEMYGFDPYLDPIDDAVAMLESADTIIGHNIVQFDIPAIRKIYKKFKHKMVFDTMVAAQLLYPDIGKTDYKRVIAGKLPGKLKGSHSLEAYGYRLGEYKGTFGKTTDWKVWTPEMSEYCAQDVVVNVKLYELLESKKPSKEAVELEMAVAKIIARQEAYGVGFDMEAAQRLHAELLGKLDDLGRKLSEAFPGFWKPGKEFTTKRDNKKLGYVADAPMTKISWEEFNPNSSEHTSYFLIKYCNWIPTTFADKAKAPVWLKYHMDKAGIDCQRTPTINDEILEDLTDERAEPLAEYVMVKKRLSQLADGNSAWLKCVDPQTFRIHGRVLSCGAVTRRMRHFAPNLAQVPNAHAPYGPECRALFRVYGKRKLVGCDASGLELRCLAHYMSGFDGGAYTKIILEGKKENKTDIHNLNAKALGISRNTAKRWIYAFLYGAGNKLLGQIAASETGYQGDMAKYGAKLRKNMMKAFPALKKLIDTVKAKVKERGYLIALDGAQLVVRSQHSALNTLLQSAGAIVMKKALVFCDQDLCAAKFQPGIDYEFVLNVHDEFQNEIINADADHGQSLLGESKERTIGEIMRKSIRKAGEYFNFKCQLDGEFIVGDNWKETH